MSNPLPESAPENESGADRLPIFNRDAFELAAELLSGAFDPIRPADFGPYRFIGDRPLGAGTVGEVWLAEDTAVKRLVAIKFLRFSTDSDSWATREMQRLGALEHPYIARLYTPGVLEDGTRWLSIEYVEGDPLDKYCEDRGLAVRQRLVLFRSVCAAVLYAHSRQIIHGDLKPSNILVNAAGEPKLLDFGLAQQFSTPELGVPESPASLGYTPAYASPEQLRNEPVGVSIDVYALGAILYQLLAGKLPFADPEGIGAEGNDGCSDRAPARPSGWARLGNNKQPGRSDWKDLDAICLKALASSIDQRYASVEALIRDLEHYINREPLDARLPHSVQYRLAKFIRRHQAPVAATTFGVVLITFLTAVFAVRLADERNFAVAESARTRRVKAFFLETFNHATEDALPSEKSRFAMLFLDRGVRGAESLGQDSVLQTDLYDDLAGMYLEWGYLDRAETIARRAVETAAHTDQRELARAKLALGNVLQERGKYAEALALANEALASQLDKTDRPTAFTLLASTYIHLNDFSRADSFNQQALLADQALYGRLSEKVADDLMNLGHIQLSRGQYQNAEHDFREALAINESVFGKESAPAADSASYIAQSLYFQGGREDEEAALLKRALTTLEKVRGGADSRIAFTLAQMGANALERKDLDTAEQNFRRSAEIYRAMRGDEHQSVAIELSNVASVYLEKKQYNLAEQAFRDVLRRFEKASLPADSVNVGIARIKLGHSLLAQKRYADAEPELLGGYTIVSKDADPSVSWLSKARQDLAEAYEALGQFQKAAAYRAQTAPPGAR